MRKPFVPERAALEATVQKMVKSLEKAAQNQLLSLQSRLAHDEKRLAGQHPLARVQAIRAKAELLFHQMRSVMDKQMTARKARIALLSDKLNALGPRQALQRGYAVVRSGRSAVTSVEQAAEHMTLLLRDGRIEVRTLETRKEDPFGEETSDV